MATAQIKGSEYPIRKIFSDEFVFRIPPYQRPYAWETEQAEELLDDLLTFVDEDERRKVDDIEPYFLGSIVLIKKDSKPEADVVDGQQRLTTLTILLSALRHFANSKTAGELKPYLMEKGSSLLGTPDRYRLTIRERDADFFQEHIQDVFDVEALREMDPARLTDPERNIRSNALRYAERLAEFSEHQRERLAGYLLKQCYLVVVSTPNFDAAYRIFSVLNDRGMNLSHTDILKADILGAIDETKRQEYADKWDDLEEMQGRDEFQELFGHIRTIYRKVKRQDTLVEEIRKYVQPSSQPKHFIDEVLEPLAESFITIRDADYESSRFAEEINHWLRWLGRIDNSDWLPPAILYFTRHQNEPEKLLSFFEQLERLAAGMMMYRANVNERIRRYAELLRLLEDEEDPLTDGSPIYLSPQEQQDVLEAVSGDLFHAYRIRTYALLRLDAALSEGEAVYDHKIISIEHVLPQSPPSDSQWVEWFPSEEMRNAYAHRLGNLVLLTRRRNSRARNYDFERKKEEYFKTKGSVSAFALTTQVVSEERWTPEVIGRRQYELLEKLRDIWRLDAVTDERLRQLAEIPKEDEVVA